MRTDSRSASPADCAPSLARRTRFISRRRKTTAPCRPARATPPCIRFTRRAASSAATARKPARSARSSWARTTSSPCTAKTISCGTRQTCSCPPQRHLPRPAHDEMQIGALGDIHGAFETVHIIMRRHADVPLWVCVGDVASNDGEYFTPEAPLHFIKGNNEDFDVIAAAMKGHPPAPTLHYLANGGPHIVGPWRVAALGGTFAPSWYNTPAASLPPSKGRKSSAATLKLGKS